MQNSSLSSSLSSSSSRLFIYYLLQLILALSMAPVSLSAQNEVAFINTPRIMKTSSSLPFVSYSPASLSSLLRLSQQQYSQDALFGNDGKGEEDKLKQLLDEAVQLYSQVDDKEDGCKKEDSQLVPINNDASKKEMVVNMIEDIATSLHHHAVLHDSDNNEDTTDYEYILEDVAKCLDQLVMQVVELIIDHDDDSSKTESEKQVSSEEKERLIRAIEHISKVYYKERQKREQQEGDKSKAAASKKKKILVTSSELLESSLKSSSDVSNSDRLALRLKELQNHIYNFRNRKEDMDAPSLQEQNHVLPPAISKTNELPIEPVIPTRKEKERVFVDNDASSHDLSAAEEHLSFSIRRSTNSQIFKKQNVSKGKENNSAREDAISVSFIGPSSSSSFTTTTSNKYDENKTEKNDSNTSGGQMGNGSASSTFGLSNETPKKKKEGFSSVAATQNTNQNASRKDEAVAGARTIDERAAARVKEAEAKEEKTILVHANKIKTVKEECEARTEYEEVVKAFREVEEAKVKKAAVVAKAAAEESNATVTQAKATAEKTANAPLVAKANEKDSEEADKAIEAAGDNKEKDKLKKILDKAVQLYSQVEEKKNTVNEETQLVHINNDKKEMVITMIEDIATSLHHHTTLLDNDDYEYILEDVAKCLDQLVMQVVELIIDHGNDTKSKSEEKVSFVEKERLIKAIEHISQVYYKERQKREEQDNGLSIVSNKKKILVSSLTLLESPFELPSSASNSDRLAMRLTKLQAHIDNFQNRKNKDEGISSSGKEDYALPPTGETNDILTDPLIPTRKERGRTLVNDEDVSSHISPFSEQNSSYLFIRRSKNSQIFKERNITRGDDCHQAGEGRSSIASSRSSSFTTKEPSIKHIENERDKNKSVSSNKLSSSMMDEGFLSTLSPSAENSTKEEEPPVIDTTINNNQDTPKKSGEAVARAVDERAAVRVKEVAIEEDKKKTFAEAIKYKLIREESKAEEEKVTVKSYKEEQDLKAKKAAGVAEAAEESHTATTQTKAAVERVAPAEVTGARTNIKDRTAVDERAAIRSKIAEADKETATFAQQANDGLLANAKTKTVEERLMAQEKEEVKDENGTIHRVGAKIVKENMTNTQAENVVGKVATAKIETKINAKVRQTVDERAAVRVEEAQMDKETPLEESKIREEENAVARAFKERQGAKAKESAVVAKAAEKNYRTTQAKTSVERVATTKAESKVNVKDSEEAMVAEAVDKSVKENTNNQAKAAAERGAAAKANDAAKGEETAQAVAAVVVDTPSQINAITQAIILEKRAASQAAATAAKEAAKEREAAKSNAVTVIDKATEESPAARVKLNEVIKSVEETAATQRKVQAEAGIAGLKSASKVELFSQKGILQAAGERRKEEDVTARATIKTNDAKARTDSQTKMEAKIDEKKRVEVQAKAEVKAVSEEGGEEIKPMTGHSSYLESLSSSSTSARNQEGRVSFSEVSVKKVSSRNIGFHDDLSLPFSRTSSIKGGSSINRFNEGIGRHVDTPSSLSMTPVSEVEVLVDEAVEAFKEGKVLNAQAMLEQNRVLWVGGETTDQVYVKSAKESAAAQARAEAEAKAAEKKAVTEAKASAELAIAQAAAAKEAYEEVLNYLDQVKAAAKANAAENRAMATDRVAADVRFIVRSKTAEEANAVEERETAHAKFITEAKAAKERAVAQAKAAAEARAAAGKAAVQARAEVQSAISKEVDKNNDKNFCTPAPTVVTFTHPEENGYLTAPVIGHGNIFGGYLDSLSSPTTKEFNTKGEISKAETLEAARALVAEKTKLAKEKAAIARKAAELRDKAAIELKAAELERIEKTNFAEKMKARSEFAKQVAEEKARAAEEAAKAVKVIGPSFREIENVQPLGYMNMFLKSWIEQHLQKDNRLPLWLRPSQNNDKPNDH